MVDIIADQWQVPSTWGNHFTNKLSTTPPEKENNNHTMAKFFATVLALCALLLQVAVAAPYPPPPYNTTVPHKGHYYNTTTELHIGHKRDYNLTYRHEPTVARRDVRPFPIELHRP
ncbi:hypothetical protein F5Y18DRAFT_426884 [Xylariaceae sp. FL1019]|nr:hypothetical protein F5Y18DRAFT_426884 [Xylariaceae sp. FL1019]